MGRGEWGEGKLVSVGEPVQKEGSGAPVRTRAPSYFARLADAATLGRAALGEPHRRGVTGAHAVAAVQDGAPWLQGFVDYHRPDAVRILDWPHAAQHLSALAQALFGEGTPRAARVGERLRRWLWADGPDRVLTILAGWQRARPDLASAVAYLRERRALGLPRLPCGGLAGGQRGGTDRVKQAGDARR